MQRRREVLTRHPATRHRTSLQTVMTQRRGGRRVQACGTHFIPRRLLQGRYQVLR